jgi:hypothetical protein
MLSDPENVSIESCRQLIRALLEPRSIIKENEMQLRECFRY